MKQLLRLVCTCLLTAVVLARRETVEESAVHTRELIRYRSFSIGTLASTYKEGPLVGQPLALQEYFAEYPESNGDLLLLAMPIAQIYRNALPPHTPQMTLTVSDLYGLGNGTLAAGRQRVVLFGSISPVDDDQYDTCKRAYLDAHPDARGWVGPHGPHQSFFVKFTVESVFAFDGFGDVAYIGWLPMELYRKSGQQIRSKEDVLKHWPVPRQPDDASSVVDLFALRDEIAEANDADNDVEFTIMADRANTRWRLPYRETK